MSENIPASEPKPEVDPATAERLERLAQRSKAAREAKQAGAVGGTRPAKPAALTQKRKHAAKGARWISLALSLVATAVLTIAFSFLSLPANVQLAVAATVPAQIAAATATTPTTNLPASSGTPSTTTVPSPVAFNGDVVDTRWGPVQVQAQITNGALTDVAVIQYPNDRGTSIQINNFALPRLTSEALTAQSAQVDSISGASVTSLGYVQSLQSAIDAAHAAGATTMT